MDVTYFILYFLTCFMGITLGMLGSGGSILLVPAMVYLLNMNPVRAADYSLFIVGTSTVLGVWKSWSTIKTYQQLIFQFGIPSLVGMLVMRGYILPFIPETLIETSSYSLSLKTAIMLLFAVSMAVVAKNMIQPIKQLSTVSILEDKSKLWLCIVGLGVGLLSGLLGVGGGFVIVPIFVLALGMSMSDAVSVSLILIAANALFGFMSAFPIQGLNLTLLSHLTLSCWVGMSIGLKLKKNIDSERLKVGFGWLIAIIGVLIVTKEMF